MTTRKATAKGAKHDAGFLRLVKNEQQNSKAKSKTSTTAIASWLGDVLHPTLRKVREEWGTRPMRVLRLVKNDKQRQQQKNKRSTTATPGALVERINVS